VIVLRRDSANELFAAACRLVLRRGRPVAPRGLPTRETLGAHLCLTHPRRRFVDLPPTRVLNPAFAVAEAVWILSGSDDPWIFDYNRRLRRYADNGRLQGAYGPRLRHWRGRVDQLDQVRQLLQRDRDSRQAMIQLFDPERDWHGYKDVPCTLGYRFFIRDGRLVMHTTMRSQDLWLGFPYDVFAATVLQELLAGWLGIEPGEYHHHVDSLHLYEHDLAAAAELPLRPPPSAVTPRLAIDWNGFDRLLSDVMVNGPSLHDLPVWRELAVVLASYRAWTAGDRRAALTVATAADGQLARALKRWYAHLAAKTTRASQAAVA
jgi:thymidylate synthase